MTCMGMTIIEDRTIIEDMVRGNSLGNFQAVAEMMTMKRGGKQQARERKERRKGNEQARE